MCASLKRFGVNPGMVQRIRHPFALPSVIVVPQRLRDGGGLETALAVPPRTAVIGTTAFSLFC